MRKGIPCAPWGRGMWKLFRQWEDYVQKPNFLWFSMNRRKCVYMEKGKRRQWLGSRQMSLGTWVSWAIIWRLIFITLRFLLCEHEGHWEGRTRSEVCGRSHYTAVGIILRKREKLEAERTIRNLEWSDDKERWSEFWWHGNGKK